MAKKLQKDAKIKERVLQQPSVYTFNLRDVPMEKYTDVLDTLFHNPNFKSAVEKRNRLVQTAERLRQNSPEIINLIKTVQQHDRKLADVIFSALVQCNVYSETTYDFLSFTTLLKYYVDYSREGIPDKVTRLATNLDKVTFLADMLEDIVTNIRGDMEVIFDGTIEFHQFDGVLNVLTQLKGFFDSARSNEIDTPEANLYYDYAESINNYLDKRLKTYTDKYRKLNPASPQYTAQDMECAINQFFDSGRFFGPNFIKRTDSGGCYIDAVALAFNLTPDQTAKLDKYVLDIPSDNSEEASLRYSFAVTDAIMREYHKQ